PRDELRAAKPRCRSTRSSLLGLLDESRAQAARADADVRAHRRLGAGVHDLGVHAAQVRALDALGLDVRVADVVRDPTLLAADGALGCHYTFPPKGGYL